MLARRLRRHFEIPSRSRLSVLASMVSRYFAASLALTRKTK